MILSLCFCSPTVAGSLRFSSGATRQHVGQGNRVKVNNSPSTYSLAHVFYCCFTLCPECLAANPQPPRCL